MEVAGYIVVDWGEKRRGVLQRREEQDMQGLSLP
jgi:hypothetical protein